jgi:two-component sensor histidine kinase
VLLAANTAEWHGFLERQAHNEAHASARLVSTELNQIVESSRNLMLALAHHPGVPDREEECSGYFKAVIRGLPIYREAAVIDRTGRFHCSTIPIPPTLDVRDRVYFSEPLETGRLTVGTLTVGRVTRERSIHVSMPYKREDGGFDGIVVLILDPEQIAVQFSARPRELHHRVSVLDRDGTLVFTVPTYDEAEARTITRQVFERTRLMPPGTLVAGNSRGEPEIVGYVPLDFAPAGLFVAVGIDRDVALAQVWDTAWRFVIFGLIAVLLALLGTTFAAWWLLQRPVQALVETARRREAGETAVQFPRLSLGSEYGRLSAALSGMSGKVDRLLEQKEFLLRELQHRVMNSLQILSSLLMMQEKHADPKTRKQLAQARDRVLSMGRVYKHLYRTDSVGEVQFDEFLRVICAESERAYGGVRRATITCDTVPLVVSGGTATSLAVLMHELITNALKHAYPGREQGPILVQLKRLAKGGIEFRVADQGRGMPRRIDLDDPPSLGLRVIVSTARQFGGSVVINRLEPGTEFVIHFPQELEAERGEAA